MKIKIDRNAEISLLTLGAEDRSHYFGLIDRLKGWKDDPQIRDHSKPLPGDEGLFVFMSPSEEVVITFKPEGDTIVIIDVTEKASLRAFKADLERSRR